MWGAMILALIAIYHFSGRCRQSLRLAEAVDAGARRRWIEATGVAREGDDDGPGRIAERRIERLGADARGNVERRRHFQLLQQGRVSRTCCRAGDLPAAGMPIRYCWRPLRRSCRTRCSMAPQERIPSLAPADLRPRTRAECPSAAPDGQGAFVAYHPDERRNVSRGLGMKGDPASAEGCERPAHHSGFMTMRCTSIGRSKACDRLSTRRSPKPNAGAKYQSSDAGHQNCGELRVSVIGPSAAVQLAQRHSARRRSPGSGECPVFARRYPRGPNCSVDR